MAHDMFVNWQDDPVADGLRKPGKKAVEHVIRSFFGKAAIEIEWKRDRWWVRLSGKWSDPLYSVVPRTKEFDAAARESMGAERWIEVWPSRERLDVHHAPRRSIHRGLCSGAGACLRPRLGREDRGGVMPFVAHGITLVEQGHGTDDHPADWNVFATEDGRFTVHVHLGQGKPNGWYITGITPRGANVWAGSLDRACQLIKQGRVR